MKSADLWEPSKYTVRNGRLRASLDTKEVGVASRHITDLIARQYSDSLPKYARGHLLDLGCGKVPLYLQYRELVSNVTCVDWPQSPHDINHIDLEADLNEPLALPTAGFDTVLMSDVLEHLPRPAVTLVEVARILRPGGYLLFNTPFLYGIHEAPHDYYRYTQYALARLAGEAGFGVELVRPVGTLPDVLIDLLSKAASRSIPKGGALSRLVQFAGRTRTTRPIPNEEQPTDFPLGYFVVARRL